MILWLVEIWSRDWNYFSELMSNSVCMPWCIHLSVNKQEDQDWCYLVPRYTAPYVVDNKLLSSQKRLIECFDHCRCAFITCYSWVVYFGVDSSIISVDGFCGFIKCIQVDLHISYRITWITTLTILLCSILLTLWKTWKTIRIDILYNIHLELLSGTFKPSWDKLQIITGYGQLTGEMK
jgi:hypothetical protein